MTPSTTTVISFDTSTSNHLIRSTTAFSEIEAIMHSDVDIVIKPKYTQEFKIKVRSIKIDKSLPKMFID